MQWEDQIPDNEKVYMLISNEQYNNFYKIDGNMYIKDVKTEVLKESENYRVTFDVYNRESVSGVVEIYDANGNLIEVEWIDSFKSWAENVGDFVDDVFKVGTDEIRAEKTSLEIRVPTGGYFRVTNNENISTSLKLHNKVNEILNVAGGIVTLFKGMMGGVPENELKQALVDVIATEIMKEFVDFNKDFTEDTIRGAMNNVIDNLIKQDKVTENNPYWNSFLENLTERLEDRGVVVTTISSTINVVTEVAAPLREIFFTTLKVFNWVEEGWSKKDTKHAKATNFTVWY